MPMEMVRHSPVVVGATFQKDCNRSSNGWNAFIFYFIVILLNFNTLTKQFVDMYFVRNTISPSCSRDWD